MKHLSLILFCIFLFLFSHAQDKLSEEKKDLIQSYLKNLADGTEFSLAFVEGDEVSYYGLTKQKGQIKEAKKQDHIFQIGSLSKVFTTQLLFFLLEEGKLQTLDESLDQYIKLPIKGNPAISFRQLASHTSGLPADPDNLGTNIFNAKNPYKEYSKEKLEDYLMNHLEMNAEPGSAYKYSNLGMSLLGYAITEISHSSYEELLQDKIFQPLGMNRSSTFPQKLSPPLVTGRNKKERKLPIGIFRS